MTGTKIRWKDKDDWAPPIRCRVFGHRYRETDYVIITMSTASPLDVCKRCLSGRFEFFNRSIRLTPKSVESHARRAEMAAIKTPESATPTVVNFSKPDEVTQ